MSSSPGDLEPARLWPLQPGAFPGARAARRFARCARCCEPAASPHPASGIRGATPPSTPGGQSPAPAPRADAATAAVLAALPSGAKRSLRMCCRAGREAVDAHARRLEVKQGHELLGPAAAARMPLLQELDLVANDDAKNLALAAGLRALARGPARPRRATVWAQGGGSALGGLVSSLSGLTALTHLDLSVYMDDPRWTAPPLVLPWAHIEVGVAAAQERGRRGRGANWGVPFAMQYGGEAPYPLESSAVRSGRRSARVPGCQPAGAALLVGTPYSILDL
jgi:hypothetical protein